MRQLVLAAILTTLSSLASAAVINAADDSGFKTFQDTNTGRIWLDMDNFFDSATGTGTTTGNAMITAAQNAGFTFALRSDVEGLLNTLPLDNSQWSSYAPIMGYGVPRQLIWGMYNDGNGSLYGYAYAYNSDTVWGFQDDDADANLVANGNGPGFVDMGIWAYKAGSAATNVPEPEIYTMFMIGLGLMGFISRRRKSA